MSAKWVLASNDGLRYSYDGSGWTMGTGITLSICYNVAYGLDANANPIWVATGLGTPTMQYSSDGIQWQDASGAYFSDRGICVTYSGGVWLAGGLDTGYNNILWSSDGMYWNTITTNPFTSNTNVDGIAYDGSGLWIASGFPSDGVANIWVSTNATDWYPSTCGFPAAFCPSIAHGQDTSGNPLWVVVTNVGGIHWSSDGSGWNATTGASINFAYVFYSGDKWIATGLNNEGSAILTSQDGKDWTPSNWQTDSLIGISIAYGSDSSGAPLYILVGFNGTGNNNVLYSSNGIDWNTTQGAQPITVGRGIAYARPLPTVARTVKWVMGSDDGLRYSYDGSGWAMGTGVTLAPCAASAYGLDGSGIPLWVAVGGPGTPWIQYSPDGISWTNATGGTFAQWGLCVLYTPGLWLVGGYDPTTYNLIKWSTDGRSWTDITFDIPGSTDCTIQSIGYDGSGLYVACGGPPSTDTSRNLWNSTDGKNWYNVPSFDANDVLNSIVYGLDNSSNPIWVLGQNHPTPTILEWSVDGSGWGNTVSIDLNNVYSICYSGTQWLIGGVPTTANTLGIFYSPDGRSWTQASLDTSNGSFVIESIAYGTDASGSPLYIVVGFNGTHNVLYSSDGVNWNSTQGDQPINGTLGRNIAYAKQPPTTTVPAETTTTTISETTTTTISETTTTTIPETTTTTTRPPPCFVSGTQILCPSGYTAVEDLQSGDYVLTADRRRVPVKLYSFTIKATADTAPYRIAAHALGPGNPTRDLHVSPRHAIKDAKGRWQIPKYLAYHNKQIQQYGVGESVTYYHVECPNFYKDNLIADGAEVESYKNRQGSSGVVYMWSDALGGWERVHNKELPKQLTTHVIYSI